MTPVTARLKTPGESSQVRKCQMARQFETLHSSSSFQLMAMEVRQYDEKWGCQGIMQGVDIAADFFSFLIWITSEELLRLAAYKHHLSGANTDLSDSAYEITAHKNRGHFKVQCLMSFVVYRN